MTINYDFGKKKSQSFDQKRFFVVELVEWNTTENPWTVYSSSDLLHRSQANSITHKYFK